ncbi:two-component system response regulator [soil metagenome]
MVTEPREMKRALLIEDDAATRMLIAKHLRLSGLEVTALESGEQVLVEAARREVAFDVVVSDVHLPGMSGLDLASLILSRNPSQPIVLITGDPDAALAREALSRGPVSYLLKPFEMFELDAAVNQALVRHDVTRIRDAQPLTTAAGRVPQGWLDVVDQRSYAGPGHARRVGHLALAIAEAAPELERQLEIGELLVAAWSHELGRISGEASDPVEMVLEGARLLTERACAPGVADGVGHLHERYDGSGGPRGLAGDAIPVISQILSVADAVEHYVSAWLQAGKSPTEAVERALGLVRVQSGTMFAPAVVGAVMRQQSRVLSICGTPHRRTAQLDSAAA